MTSPFDAKIERLRTVVARLEATLNRPIQTPGSFVTGRSNRSRSLDRRHASEVDRRVRNLSALQQHRSDLAYLEARRAAWLTGEVHANGQPCADAPSRQRAARINATIAEWLRATLKPGDTVYLWSGAGVTVTRVNAKSVSTGPGCTWKYDEILPANADGSSMTPAQAVAAFKAWKNVGTSSEQPTAA